MKQPSELNRRDFLVGSSLTMGWAAGHQWLTQKGYQQTYSQTFTRQTNAGRQVVIYHDRAHFDSRPVLEPYMPPVDPASSTRRYVENLTETEFLKRHWFA